MTSVLDRPAPPPDLTLRYGPRPEHVVDLRLPPAVPDRAAPLIVLIHGGFWRPAYDRTHLGPMGHALAAAGYMVAVPEYRRAGMAEEGWTGTFGDIALAADQVADIARAHGADTSGGHLGGPLGGRSPRAVGRGPARPAAWGRIAMARSVPRHRCGLPGGLLLAAALRGVEPGPGRGSQPDGRRAGRGPRTLRRRRSRRAPPARRTRHAGPRHRRCAGAGRNEPGVSRGLAGRDTGGRPFRPDRPGEPRLAPGHGGAGRRTFRLRQPGRQP